VVAAGPQHAQAAFAIDHEGIEGVAVARDLARGQVDEGVRALGDGGEVGGVEDRPLMEPESRMGGEVPEVLQRAMGEVVEAGDLVAARDQPLRQVRADETGDPGDGDSQRTSCGNSRTRERARL
jgi:hypothetical protein